MPDDATSQHVPHDPVEARLDSWKEIAAYLRRDVKTVQRWERREGLPVRRLHHERLGSVYAYRHEIDAWVAGRQTAPAGNDNGHGSGSDTGVRAADERVATDHRRGRTRTLRPGRRVAVAFVVVLAAAGASWHVARLARRPEVLPARVAFHVEPPPGTLFAGTLIDPDPAISPDGTQIVFRAADRETGAQRLYVRRIDDPVAEPLAGTDGAMQAFWSPDARQVGFFAGGLLRSINLASRVVAPLAPAPHPGGGAWLASGDILFNPDDREGIWRLRAGRGEPAPLTAPDPAAGQRRHLSPQAAPDGRRFGYLVTHDDPRRNAVWLGSGQHPGGPLLGSRRMGRFTPDGWFLVFRDARLVAQRVDPITGALSGTAHELAEVLEGDDLNGLLPGFSVSSGGTVAYWPVAGAPLVRLTWFDRDGRQLGTVGAPGDYPFVSLAPDGRRVAVQRVDPETGAPDLWLYDLTSGSATRLTASSVNDEDPVWSPDGREILFAHHPAIGAEARLLRLSPEHPLAARPVASPCAGGHPTDWSPDGRLFVIQRSTAASRSGIVVCPASGGLPVATVDSPFEERHGRLSPDGRLLAYSSDVSGRLEVYVRSLVAGAGTTLVSHAGGAHPRWRRDGHELYYLSTGGVLMAVPTTMTARFSAGRALPLFDARPPLPLPFLDTLYDVSADGRRFLVAAADHPVTRSFTVVVNALAPLPR